MATIQEFSKRISDIEGVKSYILIRNDGHVVTHNVDDPETVSTMIVFSGLSSDEIRSVMGFSGLSYFILTRENKEKLLIFPIRTYFLGIFQQADAYGPDVIEKVQEFIHAITKQKIK